ncbi:MAG TPA: ankyrin repeat domain-containing protein [Candidatus Babeliaceae bacterium]|nr:ankyrin repeat domain-containing protein [Candidatus Babeliaceae bacterium]
MEQGRGLGGRSRSLDSLNRGQPKWVVYHYNGATGECLQEGQDLDEIKRKKAINKLCTNWRSNKTDGSGKHGIAVDNFQSSPLANVEVVGRACKVSRLPGFIAACNKIDLRAIETFLRYESVNCVDDSGRTALHWLFKQESINSQDNPEQFEQKRKILLLLINNGINLDHADKHGNTALHIAAKKNAPQAYVEALLRAGVAGDIKNKKGKVPIIVAMERRAASFMRAVTAVYMTKSCPELIDSLSADNYPISMDGELAESFFDLLTEEVECGLLSQAQGLTNGEFASLFSGVEDCSGGSF